jgi:hypothetical protein
MKHLKLNAISVTKPVQQSSFYRSIAKTNLLTLLDSPIFV